LPQQFISTVYLQRECVMCEVEVKKSLVKIIDSMNKYSLQLL
jgi:hypothetical protein